MSSELTDETRPERESLLLAQTSDITPWHNCDISWRKPTKGLGFIGRRLERLLAAAVSTQKEDTCVPKCL
jgi:hypothetical protein